MRDRWSWLLKRRVAPLVLILGLAILIQRTCEGPERTHATVVLELGEAAPRVRQIDAELIVADDVIATFHRKALPGRPIGESRFEVAMPEKDGTLRIDVDLGDARNRLVRSLHAEEGATVRVPLADELSR